MAHHHHHGSYTVGKVRGQTVVCHFYENSESHGIWLDPSPVQHSLPILLIQTVTIFFTTRLTFFLLRPLRQALIVAEITAGILLGPTFLDSFQEFPRTLFTPPSRCIIRTFAEFCLMIHMFKLGVQIDISSLRNTSKRAVTIGLWSLFVPFAFGYATYKYLHNKQPTDDPTEAIIPSIIGLNSVTSFIVVTESLSDLKILNSELGRLASSAALVGDSITLITVFVLGQAAETMKNSQMRPLLMLGSTVVYYYTIFFVLRPLTIGILRRSPDGKMLSENQYVLILLLVLVVAFCGQYLGHQAGFTSFIFGLSLPDGPPLGTHLVKCFGTMLSGILLPVYYAASAGSRVDLWTISQNSSFKVGAVIVMGYIGKFVGTVVPSLHLGLPLLEAFVLAFIMCSKGIMEIIWWVQCWDRKTIDRPQFSLLVVSTLLLIGITTPMIALLYDPSRRYMAITRRSILDGQKNWDLCTLVCVHSDYNAGPIINLLESLNPTRSNPVTVFVLQLMELTGRAVAILTAHQKSKLMGPSQSFSKRIVNAFDHMEGRSKGNIIVQHFTAFAPYASMHDDICTLALDKKTNIVIVPFHKQWGINGEEDVTCSQIRMVNQKVIEKAPCSVGILIDRSPIHSHRIKPQGIPPTSYRVAMLFLGGPDDFEALALAVRMAEDPNICLTVIQIRSKADELDCEIELTRFSNTTTTVKRIVFKEESVANGEETIQIIRRTEETCDMMIVGRQQRTKSAAISGLTAWSECPELGPLGDMLATSDFQFSVLVVQQQPYTKRELDA